MSNVLAYLVDLSNEQKRMFQEMSTKVTEIDDQISLIMFRIMELSKKLDKD